MAFQPFFLVVSLNLVLLAGVSTAVSAEDAPWKQYSDPHHRFQIQYPETTKPETLTELEPGLQSRLVFQFEQSFHSAADAGSLQFRFQISVWQNTNHLSAEAWAKQNVKPQFTLETRAIQIAGRKGVQVKTTNLAWTIVKTFVVDKDILYELNYMDVSANKLLLPGDIRSNWAAVFQRMLESFQILTTDAK